MSAWTVFSPEKYPVLETPFTIWNELQAAVDERAEAIGQKPSQFTSPIRPLLTEQSGSMPWGRIYFSTLGDWFLQTDLVEEIKKKAKQNGTSYVAADMIHGSHGFLTCGDDAYAQRRGFLYSPEKLDSIHNAYEAYLYYQRVNDMIYPLPNSAGDSYGFRSTWLNKGKMLWLNTSKSAELKNDYHLIWDRLDRYPCYVGIDDEINRTKKLIGVVEAVVVGDGWDYDEGYYIMGNQINQIFNEAVLEYPESSYITYNRYDTVDSGDARYINAELMSLDVLQYNDYNITSVVNLKDILGLKYKMSAHGETIELESPYVPTVTPSQQDDPNYYFYCDNASIFTLPEKLDLEYYDPPEDELK